MKPTSEIVALALLLTTLIPSGLCQTTSELKNFLTQKIGLSQDRIAAIRNGQAFAKSATLASSYLTEAQPSDVAPVFKITPGVSKITFYVKSSVKLEGNFEKWDATLVFTSTDASTGVLDIKIQADSVNTGNESKDKKLKGEQCFNVKKHPYITFHSTKITQTGPNSFDVVGMFTLRGVSKPETLTFIVDREQGGATGIIKGTVVFNRKDYGLGGSIPFVRIADRVEVTINFKATRVGPPLVFKGNQ